MGSCLRLRPPGFRSEVCAPHAIPAQLPRLTPPQPQGKDLCPQITLSPSCEHAPGPFLPSHWSRGFCVNSPGPSGTTHAPSSYRAVSVNVASGCSLVCGGQVLHRVALASLPHGAQSLLRMAALKLLYLPHPRPSLVSIPGTSLGTGIEQVFQNDFRSLLCKKTMYKHHGLELPSAHVRAGVASWFWMQGWGALGKVCGMQECMNT